MMKLVLLPLLLLSSCSFFGDREAALNPDPNHTHADFAVWVLGEKVDFSDAEYMSGTSTNEETHDEEDEYLNKYLHLHDEVGHVIHRHKPGLKLSDFLLSIGFSFEPDLGLDRHCVGLPDGRKICNAPDESQENSWQLFINGKPYPEEGRDQMFGGIVNYIFADNDQILMTYGADAKEVQRELQVMTDDACLYSKTCPWRGEPPAENCIADPEVPCVLP